MAEHEGLLVADLFWINPFSQATPPAHVSTIALAANRVRENVSSFKDYITKFGHLPTKKETNSFVLSGSEYPKSAPECFDIMECARMDTMAELYLCKFPLRRLLTKKNESPDDAAIVESSGLTLLRSSIPTHLIFLNRIIEILD